jgi:hypothetical protein
MPSSHIGQRCIKYFYNLFNGSRKECLNVFKTYFWILPSTHFKRRYSNKTHKNPFIIGYMSLCGWLAVLSHPVGNPKRKVWWAQRQVSLSMKSRFNRTSRRKKQLPKVDASWLGDDSRQFVYGAYLGVALRQQQRGTCTQHNQSTLPQLAVRLSISPVWCKQRIKRIMW